MTVCTVGSEPWQGSLSDRILIAENRCAALFVSTVSPARSLCAGCRPPPLHGQGPRLACRAIPIAAPAPSSVQKIRLSSDGANQLNGSQNWRADGDGYVGLHLMQVPRRRAQQCDGLYGWKRALASIVERSHPDCRKPVRCSFCFNRVTGL